MDTTRAPSPAAASEDAYVLGTDEQELQRLYVQHEAWTAQAFSLWQRAGLRAGDVVLDLGCGPGATSLDLSVLVGPQGRVIAHDRSPGFLAFVRRRCEQQGRRNVETLLGEAEELPLPEASLHAAYARWVLCWLADAGAVVQRLARALRPGGALLVHDYVDWGACKLLPREPRFDRAVAACMASWPLAHATIDIGEQLPALARQAGLVVEHLAPLARAGRPGSLEWTWITGFFDSYLPRLVERGLYDAAELAALREALAAHARDDDAHLLAPVMVEAILRKPR